MTLKYLVTATVGAQVIEVYLATQAAAKREAAALKRTHPDATITWKKA